ncbi:PDZ domain-containing protein 4-like [Salmo trutta]|uniref:PDZ domain-containing protein 4-like n=1 Tax=Salmo trutta TaxID=8032 RepID=A0A674EM25_SALTR|nr:PDZ domain-containing protein 4-like [Salmo trutta]
MGCRFSGQGQWADNGNGVKGRDLSHLSHREALQFRGDGYEQPVTTQIEGRHRRGRRRHHSQYPVSDCGTQTEQQSWEALRALGGVEEAGPGLGAYASGLYYDHMTLSPELYAANGYLPSVAYNLEDINRIEYDDDPEMMNNQPNNRNCLIDCCNTDNDEPSSFLSQSEYEGHWLDRPLNYLPLHELDSGLGCTDGSLHQGELSDPETEEGVEAPMSSPPGNTSRGSSPSSESLLSSELSDSGFHSVSTGEFRHFQKIIDGRIHNYRSRVMPREQRSKSRWDLESIPETLTCDPQAGRAADGVHTAMTHQCTMGSSSIQFRKARSPQLSRHGTGFAPRVAASSCRTEPCQRRALMLNQHSSEDLPSRSHTVHDLSDRRRASHPALSAGNTATGKYRHVNRQPPSSPNHLAVPTENSGTGQYNRGFNTDISEKRRCPLSDHVEGTWQGCVGDHRSSMASEEYNSEKQGLSKSPSKKQPGKEPADWRQFATLGHPHIGGDWPQADCPCGPLYSTLDGPSVRSRRGLSGNPRAVRNQLLKARASRLADERSEVTTDEEARGEAWAGRYWNRTERRRHLAWAREQRQRKLNRGAEGAGENGAGGTGVAGGLGGAGGPGGGCSTVLELSHRKQSRLRNHKLLDDWTTVEELLTHGTRVGQGDNILGHSPLLSVTTV